LLFQLRERPGIAGANTQLSGGSVWMWLVCQMSWQPGGEGNDTVQVSFFFAPLASPFQALSTAAAPATAVSAASEQSYLCYYLTNPPPDNFQGQAADIAPAAFTGAAGRLAASTAAEGQLPSTATPANAAPVAFRAALPEASIPGLPDYQ